MLSTFTLLCTNLQHISFCKIETLSICKRKTSLNILRTLDFTSYVGFSYTEQFSTSLQTPNGCPTFQFNPDTTRSYGQIPQVKGSVSEDCLSPPTRHFRCQSKSRWAPALLTNWYKSKIPKPSPLSFTNLPKQLTELQKQFTTRLPVYCRRLQLRKNHMEEIHRERYVERKAEPPCPFLT